MDKFNNKVRKIYTEADIDTYIPTDAPAIIGNGFLLHKTLFLIYGKKKSRKSTLAYNLGLAIASGTSFAIFDIPTPHKVLILSAEGGEDTNMERLKIMKPHFKQIPNGYFTIEFYPKIKLENPQDYEYLSELIKKTGAEILIIDPLMSFHRADENSSKEMSMIQEKIRDLIEELNISIILLHHSGRSSAKSPRGSSVIDDNYDSSICLTRNGNKTKLSFDMRNVESPNELTLIVKKDKYLFELEKSNNIFGDLFTSTSTIKSKNELAKYFVKNNILKTENSGYKKVDSYVAQGILIDKGNNTYELSYKSPFTYLAD